MKYFKSAVLIFTALALAVGLFWKIFPKEAGSEVIAQANENEKIDYKNFASGAPLFSESDVSVSAKSVILCTEGGLLLYEKQADVPLPMASITKVMTAIVALERLGVNEANKTEVLKNNVSVDGRAVGVEGSSVYLKAGESVSYEMLLYSLMLESANDAATAIAYATAESEEAFVKAMNEKAASLCMGSTVFKNPHGLSDDGHYTTARDYAKLMSYALGNPVFTEIIGTKKKIYPSSDGTLTRVLTNHNRLLTTYKNMIGGKTGFTKISGRTLVTAAEKDGTRLICVTINAPSDWNDHTELFEKGFSVLKTEEYSAEKCSFSVPVAGAEKKEVPIGIIGDVRLTVKAETEITVKYFCPSILFAPMNKGRETGRLEFYADGKKIREEKLYVLEDTPALKEEKASLWNKITEFFSRKATDR